MKNDPFGLKNKTYLHYMNRIISLTLIFLFCLISCDQKPAIEGRWVVTKVTVGSEDTTPNARWTRFNADHTLQSGNGWLQHTVGTWQIDNEKNKLTLTNTNAIKDDQEPFTINISDSVMNWSREEEGQQVEVTLIKSNALPQTYGDQLLGLWRLEQAQGVGPYFSKDTIRETDYLFLRWDRRFVIQANGARINGVYNVHGHKPELELIPYSSVLERDFWSVNFDNDKITLTRLNSDSIITRTLSRINEFP